jgi:hypothetical protein
MHYVLLIKGAKIEDIRIIPLTFLHTFLPFTMDSNEEFGIFLGDSELDSDSGADIGPPSISETENKESEVLKKGRGNSIRARVLHKKIAAQTGVLRSGLYKLRSKAISHR